MKVLTRDLATYNRGKHLQAEARRLQDTLKEEQAYLQRIAGTAKNLRDHVKARIQRIKARLHTIAIELRLIARKLKHKGSNRTHQHPVGGEENHAVRV